MKTKEEEIKIEEITSKQEVISEEAEKDKGVEANIPQKNIIE